MEEEYEEFTTQDNEEEEDVDDEQGKTLSKARKAELLHIARRSRLLWVLQARDESSVNNLLPNNSKNNTKRTLDTILAQAPAAQSVQEVIDFLGTIVNDGDNIDLDSLLLSLQADDDLEEEEKLLEIFRDKKNNQEFSSYDLFVKKLLHPQAANVVRTIQQFVTKFSATVRSQRTGPTFNIANLTANSNTNNTSSSDNGTNIGSDQPDELSKQRSVSIWTFLDHLFDVMLNCPLWAEERVLEFVQSKIDAEKFVFVKLYGVTFASDAEDEVLNKQTAERIDTLAFITAEHLDIKSLMYSNIDKTLEQILEVPVQYLMRVHYFCRCPQDKLSALRSCCFEIAQILKLCRKDGNLPGADELLPMMILTIKIANVPYLHSHIKYLQRYTRPEKLVAEAGYLLTNFVSAVYFLDNVDAHALTIEPEEFDRQIHAAKLRSKQRIGTIQQQHHIALQTYKQNNSTSASATAMGGVSKVEFVAPRVIITGFSPHNNNTSNTTDANAIVDTNSKSSANPHIQSLLQNYFTTIKHNNKKEFISIRETHL